jgi:hypothetical protein
MAANSAERRNTPPPASKENGLVAEFRMIRCVRILGGPRPKDLIEEDRDRQQTYGA